MVSLMELLPLMVDKYGQPAGWKNSQDSQELSLNAGNMKHIGPFTTPGWLRYLVLVADNRYVRLDHTVWEKAMVYTPYQLYLDGNTVPGPAGVPWVQTYLVDDEKYKIIWQPTPPQEFLAKTDIWVTAPNKNLATEEAITTATTITLTWHAILIFNRTRFLKAMREVLGGKI